MPYYIYRVTPFAQLEKLAEFDAYKPASAHAKALRVAPGTAPQDKIKLMFADTEQAAEHLLCQVRVAGLPGDE